MGVSFFYYNIKGFKSKIIEEFGKNIKYFFNFMIFIFFFWKCKILFFKEIIIVVLLKSYNLRIKKVIKEFFYFCIFLWLIFVLKFYLINKYV